jgi:hypothetical protein
MKGLWNVNKFYYIHIFLCTTDHKLVLMFVVTEFFSAEPWHCMEHTFCHGHDLHAIMSLSPSIVLLSG